MTIKNIVIIGGGFGGWYTAAAFKHKRPDIGITVVDSDKHARLGVGETLGWSAPYDLKRLIGLEDDRMFMWRTGAIYKYGFHLTNFWHDNSSVAHGKFFNLKVSALTKFYGEYDYPDFLEPWSRKSGDVGVQQAWMAINKHNNKDFSDYVAEVNESGHFTSTNSAPYDNNNQYVMRPAEGYSYHIDAEQTVALLKETVGSHATHISSAVVGADLNAHGGIEKLKLENGTELTADLFIDATGFARALLKHAPNATWNDMKGDYPDSAWVCPSRYLDPAKEMSGGTGIFGENHGWRFKVNLYHRIGNGYVFNSTCTDPALPLQRLKELTAGTRFVEPRLLQWSPGYYTNPWQDNVLPIGIAAAFVDPYDAPTFDIHGRALEDLFRVLDADDPREDYNKQHQIVMEERNLRLLFNFGLSKRSGPFWDNRRAFAADKLHLFADVVNEERPDLESRLTHFWHQMYLRMVVATDTDRTQFKTIELTDTDRAMAEAFFAYNRARNNYIKQYPWPNYYEWLKANRFNGHTSEEMLKVFHPNFK